MLAAQIASGQESEAKSPLPIQWHRDYNQGRKEAEKSKRPIFLCFTTSPDYHLRQFEQHTLPDPKVISLLSEYVCIRLDHRGNEALLKQFGFSWIPSFVITGPDGKILRTKVGYLSTDELIKL